MGHRLSNGLTSDIGDSEPYNDELRASGHMVMAAALQMPDQAMTVQVRDGKMSTTDGPFMETKEMLAGFVIIEARDLNEAVRIGAGIPLAKLGFIEVRPLLDFSKPPKRAQPARAGPLTRPTAPRRGASWRP